MLKRKYFSIHFLQIVHSSFFPGDYIHHFFYLFFISSALMMHVICIYLLTLFATIIKNESYAF